MDNKAFVFIPSTIQRKTKATAKQRFAVMTKKGDVIKELSIAAHKTIDADTQEIRYGIIQKINHKINYISVYTTNPEGRKKKYG